MSRMGNENPTGKNCGECSWLARCGLLFGCKPGAVACYWIPSRFDDAAKRAAQFDWAVAVAAGDLILGLDLQIVTLLERAKYQMKIGSAENAAYFRRRAAACRVLKTFLQTEGFYPGSQKEKRDGPCA